MKAAKGGNVLWGVAGLILGVGAMGLLLAVNGPGLMISEHRSPYDVATTVEKIQASATNIGWRVSKVYDFQASLAEVSESKLAPIQVVELCQPDYAHQLLRSSENRFVATMMPCAVAVYEKEDGNAYVASMNVGLMGRLFGGKIQTVMSQVARDDGEILGFLAAD